MPNSEIAHILLDSTRDVLLSSRREQDRNHLFEPEPRGAEGIDSV